MKFRILFVSGLIFINFSYIFSENKNKRPNWEIVDLKNSSDVSIFSDQDCVH